VAVAVLLDGSRTLVLQEVKSVEMGPISGDKERTLWESPEENCVYSR